MIRTIATVVLSGVLCLSNPVDRLVFTHSGNAAVGEMYSEQAFISLKVKNQQYINALKALGFYKNDSKDEAVNARNAILRFQCDNNLTADGVRGNRFKSAIIKRLMINGSYTHPDKIAAPPSEGYWITINQTRRILTLYEGTTVIKKYPVAIGKDSTSTPEGKFKIVIKGKNPVWINPETKERVKGGTSKNPLGYRWMGLSAGKGYKYGIHGNNSPYSIGRETSKGCIRMINSDVNELYDIIPKGTFVWIGRDSTLKKWGVRQDSHY